MPLVSVKNKYQVVIPQDLREQLGIKCGDLLEARVERGKLTYTPKVVLDRVPSGKAGQQRFLGQLRTEAPEWLQDIWVSSKRRGTDKLTAGQIGKEIAAARRNRAKSLKKPAK